MDTEGVMDLLRETAAEVVVPRFRQLSAGDIEEKNPGDFVTVADREAELYLAALLRGAYPSAVIIGEEGVFADPTLLGGVRGAEHAFLIDPIDGTRNFVSGRDEYGVMLAEVRGGVTTRGWIYQPQTGRAYVAERGAGTRLDGAPIERPATDRPPLGATAKRAIHETLEKMAASGMAVLFISSELEEVLGVCTRVLVIHRGRIQSEFKAPYDQEKVVSAFFGQSGLPHD